MASINVIDCNVVLEVEGSGALLQYPASLDVKLLEGPYGPTKPSDPAKVLGSYMYLWGSFF
jgi:hypothetical protein